MIRGACPAFVCVPRSLPLQGGKVEIRRMQTSFQFYFLKIKAIISAATWSRLTRRPAQLPLFSASSPEIDAGAAVQVSEKPQLLRVHTPSCAFGWFQREPLVDVGVSARVWARHRAFDRRPLWFCMWEVCSEVAPQGSSPVVLLLLSAPARPTEREGRPRSPPQGFLYLSRTSGGLCAAQETFPGHPTPHLQRPGQPPRGRLGWGED